MRKLLTHIPTSAKWLLASVCVCLSVGSSWAQENPAELLKAQLTTFSHKNLQEKMFLHTDKSNYLAGETIWFKVYCVEGASHVPLGLSKVAYIDILDRNHAPVAQVKVPMAKGKGAGAIDLPTSLASGNYVIRGYTNWMKNTDPGFFFQQPLSIINTFQNLGLKPVNSAVAYDVQFFPEGGHLVTGIRAKIGFKATGVNGKGISFTGAVVNDRNDTVARFYTHKFGIGSFYMTPLPGHSYRAILKGDNKEIITRLLPKPEPDGMSMELKDNRAGMLEVVVSATPAWANGQVFLLVHTRQQAVVALAGKLNTAGTVTFSLDRNKLGEGISHITIFNGSRQPVCERLYFKAPTQILSLAAASDKKEYGPRALVNLSLTAQGPGGHNLPANVSISVSRLDSLSIFEQPSFESFVWLSSDLVGNIESPEYYFSQPGPEVITAQDNLMLTQGWRRFAWGQVQANSTKPPVYLPELSGHLLYGKVLREANEKPVPFVQAYLSSPGKRIQVATAQSNAEGTVIFDLKNLYGTRDLILQANTLSDSTLRLTVNTPFSLDSATISLPVFDLKEQLQPYLSANSIHLQVQRHYTPVVTKTTTSFTDSSTFYGKPHRTYFLDDYTRFPTLEDVLREYVSPVTVRTRKGNYYFTVLDAPRKLMLDEDPLVLLDGVPVFDVNRLIGFDPKKIRKLEVVAQKFFYGGQSYGGVISFSTYTGNLDGFEVDPKALLVEYEGLQHTREFYHPVYDQAHLKTSRLPDLRNVLYWAPSIEIDPAQKKKLAFYTSDQAGRYKVMVQGISPNGLVGCYAFFIDVKPAS